MTYAKNQLYTNWNRTQKHPVFEDKSEARRKVIIVKGTVIDNLRSEYFLTTFSVY